MLHGFIAGNNFTDSNALIIVLIEAILMMALLLPGAGELGKRQAGVKKTVNEASKSIGQHCCEAL